LVPSRKKKKNERYIFFIGHRQKIGASGQRNPFLKKKRQKVVVRSRSCSRHSRSCSHRRRCAVNKVPAPPHWIPLNCHAIVAVLDADIPHHRCSECCQSPHTVVLDPTAVEVIAPSSKARVTSALDPATTEAPMSSLLWISTLPTPPRRRSRSR
jgi:hypothetical protein